MVIQNAMMLKERRGCFLLPAFGTNKYYWKVYRRPEYFRTDVQALSCKVEGYNIARMCELEFSDLREVIAKIDDVRTTIVSQLVASLDRMIDIGLPYISLGQPLSTFSGGERQRVKLADYIIDVGPDGGSQGGQIVFTGTPKEMMEKGDTITAKYLRK